MKARWLGTASIFALSLAFFLAPKLATAQSTPTAVATPATFVNTGPGPATGGGGESLFPPQYTAAQFTLADPSALTQIQAWIGAMQTPCAPCTINVVIRSNNNAVPSEPVPGASIWSQTYTVTPITGNNWMTFANYGAVLAPGTYWASFEVPTGSGFNAALIGSPAGALPATSYAFLPVSYGAWFNFSSDPYDTNFPAITISGLDLGTASGAPLITSGTAARTALEGTLFNQFPFSQFLNAVGGIGQPEALQWNIVSPEASASADGFISANPKAQGDILTAGAYSATGSASTGAARGIVFSTYLNTGAADIPNVQVNAVLNGLTLGADAGSPVQVSAAAYVFDTAQFSTDIYNSGESLPQFLLGGNAVVPGYGSAFVPDLSQLFSNYVDSSFDSSVTAAFPMVCTSTCSGPYSVSTAGFYLPAHTLFTVMFDVSAASQGSASAQSLGIGDFLDTLMPDLTNGMFTDGNGHVLTGIVGPIATTLPDTPTSITFNPSSVSAPIGSMATLVATVTDAAGIPIPNAVVRFAFSSGPHSGFGGSTGTPVGTDANGNATFTFIDTLGQTGFDSITASIGSLQSSAATIDWTSPGPPNTITLNPPSTSIALPNGQSYTASGTDIFNNPIAGDISGELTFAITPDGSCSGAICTPTVNGPHTVTATYNNPGVGSVMGTASLSVGTTSSSLVITASSPSMTFGGTVPTITPLYTYGASTLTTVAPAGLTTAPTCITAATSSSPVGSSPSTSCSGGADANYTISYVAGSVTVNAASLTITASSPSMTFGGTVPTITPLYTYGASTLTTVAPAGLTTAPTCVTTATSSSPVGSSPSTSCSGAVDANYTIGYVAGSVTVNAASLTITASSPSMTFGGTVPTITPLYTYGTSTLTTVPPAGLTTAPSCITTATSGSSVASYPTSCSGAVDADYTIGYVSGSLKVNPASLTITASSPTMTAGGTVPAITAAYTYGSVVNSVTPPGGLTLPVCSAPGVTTSSAPGTYPTSCSGAVDSNDTIGYVAGILTVSAATGKTNPVITWPTPAPITYGTPLSGAQLDASANVAGTFIYSPAAKVILTAGSQTLSVTFTPTNTSLYNTVTTSVRLQVNQATPPMLWIPVPIVYGTPFGPLQLDALTSVPGNFVFTPPAGTILHPGNQPLSAVFTPKDATDFQTITVHATLVVVKALPIVTWAQPAAITAGTALSAAQLNANANLKGMFVYNPPAGTILPAGTATLRATFTPADAADYQTVSTQVLLTIKAKK